VSKRNGDPLSVPIPDRSKEDASGSEVALTTKSDSGWRGRSRRLLSSALAGLKRIRVPGMEKSAESLLADEDPGVAVADEPDPDRKLGDRIESAKQVLTDAILVLPYLVKLVYGLLRDKRVPSRSKLLLALSLAYVVSPVDLLPEAIPVLGLADDLILMAFSLSHLIEVAGDEVVLDHWEGSKDILELVRSVVEIGSDLMPAGFRFLLSKVGH